MPRSKKTNSYTTNGNNNITDVIKELWQAAVNLARLYRAGGL